MAARESDELGELARLVADDQAPDVYHAKYAHRKRGGGEFERAVFFYSVAISKDPRHFKALSTAASRTISWGGSTWRSPTTWRRSGWKGGTPLRFTIAASPTTAKAT